MRENMTFRELTEEWMKTLQSTHNSRSLDDTKRDLRFLHEDIGDLPLSAFTVDFIREYFSTLDTRTFESGYAIGKKNIRAVLGRKGFFRRKLLEEMGVAKSTLSYAFNGSKVPKKWATRFSEQVGIPYEELFDDYGEKKQYHLGTTQRTKSVIRRALAYAKEKGYIEENYARVHFVRSPSVEHQKIAVPTDAEIRTFFDTAMQYPDVRIRAATMLLFAFNFNRHEVNSLTWGCFDFDANTITSTNRTVNVLPGLMAVIQDYREWQKEKEPFDNDFVFRKNDGSPTHEGTLKGWFRKVLKRANLTDYTLTGFQRANFDCSSLVFDTIPKIRTVGREQYYKDPIRIEMRRLGFTTYNEYLDYLEFVASLENRQSKRNKSEME